MKAFILSICLFIYSLVTVAQDKKGELFYLFDKDGNAVTDMKQAITFLHVFKIDDSTWRHDFYNLYGPKISEENYRDALGKSPNGNFAYFNERGYLDSSGYIADGRRHGDWYYFLADSGKVIFRKTYNNGTLLKTTDYSTLVKEKEDVNDVVRVEVESEFPGGIGAWGKFLNKNMDYPKRAYDGNIQGMVWVFFIVDQAGKVSDVGITKSVEYSIDEEAMRVIKKTPKWIPAVVDGRKVKSYKKQPITFKLQ